MPEPIIALLAVAIPALLAWVLGYNAGINRMRNKHAQMVQALRDFEKEHPYRDTNWDEGYRSGVATTMDALQGFIDNKER